MWPPPIDEVRETKAAQAPEHVDIGDSETNVAATLQVTQSFICAHYLGYFEPCSRQNVCMSLPRAAILEGE
jgi:hypothetical protein